MIFDISRMPSINRLSIGIVDGAISGCTAAVALMRAGHRVTIESFREPDMIDPKGKETL